MGDELLLTSMFVVFCSTSGGIYFGSAVLIGESVPTYVQTTVRNISTCRIASI